jgi:nitric-oxide synthase
MDERSTSASASDPTLSAHDGGFRTHPGDAAHSSSLTADLAPAALTTTTTTPLTRPGLAGLTAPPPTGEPRPAGTVDPVEAEAFLRQFFAENPSAGNPEPRVREVLATIDETGTYSHTSAELAHGARVAWRNSSRCIGRLYWRSLVVRDRRHVGTATGVFHESVEHLRLATNGGRIRPMITVFAPQEPDQPGPRIWNEQLIRYAGHREADGSIVGDPRYAGLTDTVTRMGWQGNGGRFDVLPLVIEMPGQPPELFELPREDILEVEIRHPRLWWFEELELRWHAVPAISSMRLEIGGISYTAAPFNGWYMGTEIGARNLADTDRYDLLPEIARRLGLDTRSDRTLWKDRALVELNVAVLWSYEQARVTIADHHTESRRFLTHIEKEERAGRKVPADWTWIVPPMSSGATPVFHRYYDEGDLRPNFFFDEEARERGRSGAGGCPVSGHGRPE